MQHKKKYSIVTSNLKFDLDMSKYYANIDKAQEALIYQIKTDTEQYVPARDLTLSNSAHAENDNTELVYSTPYARFQYMGKLMVDARGSAYALKGTKKHVVDKNLVYGTERHPSATSHWYEVAEERYKDSWIKLVKEIVTRG